MSEVLTEEQIKAFRATGSVACGDGINTQYVAPDARKMILNTIDHWKQRAERAEADRKVLADLLVRATFFVECDVQMMADITRHAPLGPDAQAKHDSTEYPSEVLLRDINAARAALGRAGA